jgi:hypothetical protein
MKKTTKYGAVALALLAVVAIGGVLAEKGDSDTTSTPDVGAELPADGVMTSIEAALGGGSDLRAQVQPAPSRSGATSEGAAPAAGPPDAVKSGGAAVAPAAPDSTFSDRKIVQTATIRLQVEGVNESFADIGNIAAEEGGFVASSNFAYQGEHQVATITIRVPAQSYQSVLARVRELGARVDAETSNASDVTEEYSDLQARIRTLEATEARLLELLARAANVNEVLQVQDRITAVRTQIEQAQGRLQLLEKLSDYATISVHLRPVAPSAGGGDGVDLGEEIAKAWEDSLEFLGGVAAGVVSVLVFSWWLIPLAIPGAIAWQRWQRSRPAATPAAYD